MYELELLHPLFEFDLPPKFHKGYTFKENQSMNEKYRYQSANVIPLLLILLASQQSRRTFRTQLLRASPKCREIDSIPFTASKISS